MSFRCGGTFSPWSSSVLRLSPSIMTVTMASSGRLQCIVVFSFLLFLVLISFFESGVVLQNYPQVITAHWTCAEYPTLVENKMTRILYHPHRLRSSDNKRGIIKKSRKRKQKNSDPCISMMKTPCTAKDTQWPQKKNKILEITRSWQQNRVEYIPTQREKEKKKKKKRNGGKRRKIEPTSQRLDPGPFQRDQFN